MARISELLLKAWVTVVHEGGALRREKGQDLIEYALLGGLVAIFLVAVIILMRDSLNTVFTSIKDCLASIPGGGGCPVGGP